MTQKLRNCLAARLMKLSIRLMAWAVDLSPDSTGMNSKPNKDNP